MKHFIVGFYAGVLVYGLPFPALAGSELDQPVQKFKREEFMLMNLNRGQFSTGAQVSNSLKETRQMIKVLDKALRQLEHADQEFAKSKGRPDDHFLGNSAESLKQAINTAKQLESQLETARNNLKDSIQESLIAAP